MKQYTLRMNYFVSNIWVNFVSDLYNVFTHILKCLQDKSTQRARSIFLEKAKAASEACANGNFDLAVKLYSEAIDLDPGNHVLYSNRSAACIRTKHFEQAFEDGRKAAELQPGWSKVSFSFDCDTKCIELNTLRFL